MTTEDKALTAANAVLNDLVERDVLVEIDEGAWEALRQAIAKIVEEKMS
jgi:hypothetical protein